MPGRALLPPAGEGGPVGTVRLGQQLGDDLVHVQGLLEEGRALGELTLAALALARSSFRGRELINMIFLSPMMIPPVAASRK